MYGLVDRAIEDLVCARFGGDTWKRVRRRAGIAEAVFSSRVPYLDQATYQLAGAASQTPARDGLTAN